MSSNSPTKVIVVGAGIAGPVLSLFLKTKGYDPVVFERTDDLTEAGLSLCLQPNGLHVLAKIPGLVEGIEGRNIDKFGFYSVLPEDQGVIAENDIPRAIREEQGVGMRGVRRTVFHRYLVEAAKKAGVPVKWGHKLVGLEQGENSVTAKFDNGVEETASFLVGCDGLHSNTRICLFGQEKADFTGLVQTGGVCTMPDSIKNDPPTMRNVFGDGVHMIVYPVNDTQCSWAMTQREPEAKETWRAMNQDSAKEFRERVAVTGWGYGAGDIVKSTESITKYGLYDRPQLQSWHKQRVCLIGDAAHPTSPHLGQGANQAFEDVDLMIELLERCNPSAASPPTATLKSIFTEFEKTRIPRSAALVKQAREQGESRVVEGVGNCIKRNAAYREVWKDRESVTERMTHMYDEQ